MSTHFKQLKQAPLSLQCLIYGYFREYEEIYTKANDNDPYYNFPEISILLTLSYYAILSYFDITATDAIQLSNDNCTIIKTSSDNWDNTSYGSHIIDPAKDTGNYKWWIKVEAPSIDYDDHDRVVRGEIGFGSDFTNVTKLLYRTYPPFCTLDCQHGYVDVRGAVYVDSRPFLNVGEIKIGDIICMEFNVDGDNSYIKFSKNSCDKICIIKAEEIKMKDVKYRLAVSICKQNDSFSIVDFKYT